MAEDDGQLIHEGFFARMHDGHPFGEGYPSDEEGPGGEGYATGFVYFEVAYLLGPWREGPL